jgi:hypothetical protein
MGAGEVSLQPQVAIRNVVCIWVPYKPYFKPYEEIAALADPPPKAIFRTCEAERIKARSIWPASTIEAAPREAPTPKSSLTEPAIRARAAAAALQAGPARRMRSDNRFLLATSRRSTSKSS